MNTLGLLVCDMDWKQTVLNKISEMVGVGVLNCMWASWGKNILPEFK